MFSAGTDRQRDTLGDEEPSCSCWAPLLSPSGKITPGIQAFHELSSHGSNEGAIQQLGESWAPRKFPEHPQSDPQCTGWGSVPAPRPPPPRHLQVLAAAGVGAGEATSAAKALPPTPSTPPCAPQLLCLLHSPLLQGPGWTHGRMHQKPGILSVQSRCGEGLF